MSEVFTMLLALGRQVACHEQRDYRASSDHTLIRPDFNTLFEITPEGGEMLRVTWRQVMDWGKCAGCPFELATMNHAR